MVFTLFVSYFVVNFILFMSVLSKLPDEKICIILFVLNDCSKISLSEGNVMIAHFKLVKILV